MEEIWCASLLVEFLCSLHFKKKLSITNTDVLYLQLAGLKYFDDMQEKIPREEGGKIAGHVRSLILDVFHWSIDGEDAAHVRQMGSFLRGKPKLSVSLTFLVLV